MQHYTAVKLRVHSLIKCTATHTIHNKTNVWQTVHCPLSTWHTSVRIYTKYCPIQFYYIFRQWWQWSTCLRETCTTTWQTSERTRRKCTFNTPHIQKCEYVIHHCTLLSIVCNFSPAEAVKLSNCRRCFWGSVRRLQVAWPTSPPKGSSTEIWQQGMCFWTANPHAK